MHDAHLAAARRVGTYTSTAGPGEPGRYTDADHGEPREDQEATVRDVERFMAGELSPEALAARVAARRRTARRE
jgi:hypothetical protein